ncbi:MAG: dihydroorotate dehydrogenase electron transfer subunit [Candidatus Thorarchaeota archaeon]
MTENTIQTVRIKEIIVECEGVKTFVFNVRNNLLNSVDVIPIPGQFVMVWVPGIDEVPMSLSGANMEGDWRITVKNVGECTKAMHKLKKGDFIGFRGPLGNGFSFPEEKIKKVFLIGGGVGIAPLKWLSFELLKLKKQIVIIEGAKSNNQLMFIKELDVVRNSDSQVMYCTDDGSFGSNELVSENFNKILQKQSKEELFNTMVYTCGPERMMHKIFQICERKRVPMQASLERVMRCGCGLCGLCVLDPLGLLVCKDGPVFNSEQLKRIEDFGYHVRDFTGKKVPLD